MHPFLCSGFQEKIYFISECSGKSSSEEIHIPFLSILLFILTCISTVHFCVCVFSFELLRNGGRDRILAYVVYWRSALGKMEVKIKVRGAGWGKERSWAKQRPRLDPTGTAEDELNTPRWLHHVVRKPFFLFSFFFCHTSASKILAPGPGIVLCWAVKALNPDHWTSKEGPNFLRMNSLYLDF